MAARVLPICLVVGLIGAGGVEAASALGPAVLVSVTVAPTAASVAQGRTEQFTATGTYSDLSTRNLTDTVTWSSSLTSAATVSNASGSQGLATGVGTGASTITATAPSSIIKGTAVLTVTPAVLVSIAVTPAVASITAGTTQQFTATGTYSDLSTRNLTSSVTWSSSLTSAATVSNAPGTQGLATGVATGATTITATDPATLIPGTAALTVTPIPPPPVTLVSIAVTPAVASITAGTTQQFTATGTYSDLSTRNLTSSVTWSSSLTSAATVSNAPGTQGLATGVATGATTITATDPSTLIPGTAALTVTPIPPPPVTLVSIAVTPALSSITAGATQQFTATGTYSDLSTRNLTSSVTWSSSLTSAATVSNAPGTQGLATGVATGATTITATDPSTLIPGTAALTVTPLPLPPPVLVSIAVAPALSSITAGATQQFTATGTYSDLSTRDLTSSVTWSSSLTSAATVSNAPGTQGLATGVATGVTTITATDPATLIPGTAALTVTPISVLPPPGSPPSTFLTSPSSGARKSTVVAQGTGFNPGDHIVVRYLSGLRSRRLASTLLCQAAVAADGSFSCSGKIPRRTRSGRRGAHSIVAITPAGTQRSTTFTLVK